MSGTELTPATHAKSTKGSPNEHHFLSADELLELEPDKAFEAALRHEAVLCVNDKHALEWAKFVQATVAKYRLTFAETAALAIEQESFGLTHASVHEWTVNTCMVIQRKFRIALRIGQIHLSKVMGGDDRVAYLCDHRPMGLLGIYGLEDN